jgi:hypothetical protein
MTIFNLNTYYIMKRKKNNATNGLRCVNITIDIF